MPKRLLKCENFKIESVEEGMKKKLFLVVVTYNRIEILKRSLLRLVDFLENGVDYIYVYNNASTDGTDKFLLEMGQKNNRVKVRNLDKNLGGAGGFSIGMKEAFNNGAQWVGLLDDDVLLDQNCIKELDNYFDSQDCLIAVREDLEGNLAEYAAVKYGLKNPFRINPKVKSVKEKYGIRENCPPLFEIACGSFEGFFVSRRAALDVGFPNASYFIYGDDFDYSLRLRKKGYKILAVRDAKIVRLLSYSKTKLNSWKSYYIWRNFFILHFVYGENVFVRLKPYFLMVVLFLAVKFRRVDMDVFKIFNDALKISETIVKFNKIEK